MPDAQHGADFSGVMDIDLSLSVVSGRQALAQSILRRLSTRTGTLRDDPSYGDDIRLFIGKAISPDEVAQRVEAQVFADERIRDARVTVDFLGEDLNIHLVLVDATGPFRLVVGVSELSLDLLEFS